MATDTAAEKKPFYYDWVVVIVVFLAGFAEPALIFDNTGSYTLILSIYIVLLLVSAAVMFTARPQAKAQ